MRRKGMLKTDNFVIGIQYRWKICRSEKKNKQRKKETDRKKRFSIIKSIVFREKVNVLKTGFTKTNIVLNCSTITGPLLTVLAHPGIYLLFSIKRYAYYLVLLFSS